MGLGEWVDLDHGDGEGQAGRRGIDSKSVELMGQQDDQCTLGWVWVWLWIIGNSGSRQSPWGGP